MLYSGNTFILQKLFVVKKREEENHAFQTETLAASIINSMYRKFTGT